MSNLFYDDDLLNIIQVNTNIGNAALRYNLSIIELITGSEAIKNVIEDFELKKQVYHGKLYTTKGISEKELIPALYLSTDSQGYLNGQLPQYKESKSVVKKYYFKDSQKISNEFPDFLLPPVGENLFTIVDHNKELRKEIADIFAEYGLQFVAYKKESKFEIEKNIDGYINKYHYSSMADTFQRLIFYFAAIDSNKDSVLILEEPEVHSFPPYTKELSERIIDSSTNQFFITTHSPYLLNNLISSLDDEELSVFITYFDDYQTKVKKLTGDELKTASAFGVDLFFNLNNFIPNA